MFTSANRVFQLANIDPYTSVGLSIALFSTGLVSNFIAVFLMDKFGRRPFLMVSFGGQAVFALMGAVALYISATGQASNNVVIVALFLFFFMYGFGVGPIPCAYLGEIFPVEFKAFG